MKKLLFFLLSVITILSLSSKVSATNADAFYAASAQAVTPAPDGSDMQLQYDLMLQNAWFSIGSEYVTIPEIVPLKQEYSVKIENRMQTYYLNSDNESGITVFFLHGGAFINQPMMHHWIFISDFINRTDAEVIVPIYPQGPFHTYNETYEKLLVQYYSWKIANPGKKAVFIGDSAGGNLAAGMIQRLSLLEIPGPDKTVLISPWTDLTMSNPAIMSYPGMAEQAVSLKALAAYWIGGADPASPVLSPLYGDLSAMPETLIITGTEDFLYPDIIRLSDKMKASMVSVNLYVAQGEYHDYPIMNCGMDQDTLRLIASFTLNKS